jgi:hypothetical protein
LVIRIKIYLYSYKKSALVRYFSNEVMTVIWLKKRAKIHRCQLTKTGIILISIKRETTVYCWNIQLVAIVGYGSVITAIQIEQWDIWVKKWATTSTFQRCWPATASLHFVTICCWHYRCYFWSDIGVGDYLQKFMSFIFIEQFIQFTHYSYIYSIYFLVS